MKAFLIGVLLATAMSGSGQAGGLYGSKNDRWGTASGNGFDLSASSHYLQGQGAAQNKDAQNGTLSSASISNYSIGVVNSNSASGGSTINSSQYGQNSGGISTKGIFSNNR